MVGEQGEKEQGESKGFSGLTSLISNVDDVVESASQAAARQSPSSWASADAEKEHESERQPYQQPPSPQANTSSAGKWLIGLGVSIGALWLISSIAGNKNAGPPSALNSTVSVAPVVTPSTNDDKSQYLPPVPPSRQAEEKATPQPAPRFVFEEVPPSRQAEEKPPVGTNSVLDAAQIRYCLSEDIRLGAAKDVVNAYSEQDVDRFNAMVADYNSRCSQFRYRRGLLESVRSEVTANRSILEAEGIARFR